MTDKKELALTNDVAGEFLKKFGKSLNEYAIREYNKSSFLKSAMIAISNDDKLLACLKTPKGKVSLFDALRYAATTGRSLNPQEGKACIVPRGGKIQYWIIFLKLLHCEMLMMITAYSCLI